MHVGYFYYQPRQRGNLDLVTGSHHALRLRELCMVLRVGQQVWNGWARFDEYNCKHQAKSLCYIDMYEVASYRCRPPESVMKELRDVIDAEPKAEDEEAVAEAKWLLARLEEDINTPMPFAQGPHPDG